MPAKSTAARKVAKSGLQRELVKQTPDMDLFTIPEMAADSNGPEEVVLVPSTIRSSGPSCPPSALDWKEEIIQTVAANVSAEVEAKTKQQMEQVWHKSMESLHDFAQEQNKQICLMQSQVTQFAESNQRLQDENLQLRGSMQQVMHFLQHFVNESALSRAGGHALPAAGGVQQQAVPAAVLEAEAADNIRPSQVATRTHVLLGNVTPPPGLTCSSHSTRSASSDASRTSSPPGSPAGPSLGSSSSSRSGSASPKQTDSEASTSLMTASPTLAPMRVSFELTLRRVENAPLGLVVQPDSAAQCLLVTDIRPGTVLSAWNMQNIGGRREVRCGDRVMSVNGQNEVSAMRDEFINKLLLKLVVQRGEISALTSSNSCTSSSGSGSSTPELRPQDASEGVPQTVMEN
jgi:hypothetical protein